MSRLRLEVQVKQFSNISATQLKINCAQMLFYALYPIHRNRPLLVKRKGLNFNLIPSEGIDFSIYLFGGFQNQIRKTLNQLTFKQNPVFLDVGANIGYVTLLLAKLFPDASIYSFEPTDYGFGRLTANLKLNPNLAQRIHPTKVFISDKEETTSDLKAYARWSLTPGAEDSNRHPVHMGSISEAQNVGSITLDKFIELNRIPAVDFIKIDTDGHEWEVLMGAKQTLLTKRPAILFEIGQYLWEEKDLALDQLFEFFEPLGYSLSCSVTGQKVTRENAAQIVPRRTTTDLLALPTEKTNGASKRNS